ncbi:hypothetical protein SISNIDRAFT_36073 [Sistotremastrum niveocremeum HHB9708]|uniref:N-acetyltransferase domain-containing protein n=1 Tax=Sistotremastrum niveocremeum HHB9708 TaxID=1314777 RepID=A0A164WF47_9AGAM|nr:hypothetical protein SISNIDRAFT_36073 [Sistotremastrum niveocremeum HHB9708]
MSIHTSTFSFLSPSQFEHSSWEIITHSSHNYQLPNRRSTFSRAVKRLTFRKIGTAAQTIRRAFKYDLYTRYIAGEDGIGRPGKMSLCRKIRCFLGCWTWIARKDIVLELDDGRALVVLWRAPEDPKNASRRRSLRSVIVDNVSRVASSFLDSFEPDMIKKRKRELKSAHDKAVRSALGDRVDEMMYIHLLATAPLCQGQGLGGQLLDCAGELADIQGRAIWLISSGLQNVPFYNAHGFETVGEMVIGNTDRKWGRGPIYCPLMVREPTVSP